MLDDQWFMRQALVEAQKAFDAGEVPVGVVVVCENQILSRTHNQTEQLTDVTAHAEIMALGSAAEAFGSKYLTDMTLYVTLEPCAMCAAALHWAQLGRLVFGAADLKRGFSLYRPGLLHPKTTVKSGVMAEECSSLLKRFFEAKR